MASGASPSIKRVLLLFTKEQAKNSEKLRTVLESESAGDVEVVDLVDIAVGKPRRTLEDELERCDCVVLLCSPRATELIDNEKSETFKVSSGHQVTFDGKRISEKLKDNNGNFRQRLVPVSFVELPAVLHTAARGCRKGAICFGVKQGKVTEKMLEGDVLQSLIAVIMGSKPT